MKKLLSLLLCLIFIPLFSRNEIYPIKIACIGDSLTAANPPIYTYPLRLADKMGINYDINNYGYYGACVNGDISFRNLSYYTEVYNFSPNIILLMLGTNDSKTANWNENNFRIYYQSIIDYYSNLDCEIIICTPPVATANSYTIQPSVIETIVGIEKEIANTNGLRVIDVNAWSKTISPSYFVDGVHFTDSGYNLLGDYIYSVL